MDVPRSQPAEPVGADASAELYNSNAPTVSTVSQELVSEMSGAPIAGSDNSTHSENVSSRAQADSTMSAPSVDKLQPPPQPQSAPAAANEGLTHTGGKNELGTEAGVDEGLGDVQTAEHVVPSASTVDTAAAQLVEPTEKMSVEQIAPKSEGEKVQITPSAAGRGRSGGRPRGRGRGGARGAKRKRGAASDEESEESEVYSPAVTTTKSGRSVQKPASFVPPPPSPTSTNKRKRTYRKNPETAVCKICLRGTSPADNMIVFCDGCNTPYHRYCHHPPIDQAVVDEVDKEWYCKQCERARVVPIPESEVLGFISAEGAPVEQRQRYFASLPPGMLVTLLTRATSLRPDLPLFAPDFRARVGSSSISTMPSGSLPPEIHSHPQQAHRLPGMAPGPTMYPGNHSTAHAAVGAPGHHMHYVHPAEQQYGPNVHPPNYPRPGHGLMRTLPPEQQDLHWLVEEEDRYGVFSHMYQVDPRAANAGMHNGAMNMNGMRHVR